MVASPINIPGTGDAIRRHQLSKGGAVMSPSALDAHLASQFSKKAEETPAPVTKSLPHNSIPFRLEVETPGPRVVRRKAKNVPEAEKSPKPTHLVEYRVKLEGGATLSVPEYAHLVHLDGEVLILAFPITNKTRIKPDRGTDIEITIKSGTYLCFAPGIHTDIPEWGISQSFYIVKETL
jgi:hypothetical protein